MNNADNETGDEFGSVQVKLSLRGIAPHFGLWVWSLNLNYA